MLQQDNLGGSETNSCTNNPAAMCDVWTMKGKTGEKVYYQEYAQTGACGCVGCNASKPDPKAYCETVHGGQLNGCAPRAILATPYYKEMRRSCDWGYAYPFDDNKGGLVCTGAKSLTMTIADGTGGPNPGGGGGGDESRGWEIVLYVVVSLLLVGVLGCNFWHGFVAWRPCLVLLSVYTGCLVLAWFVWKGEL